MMLYSLSFPSNEEGHEDTSFCSTTVNLWPETFVDLDAEKHETWTLSPYFWWRGLFLLQAELWRTLWWKQNCSHHKGSWHTARPCLLLVVEGRAKSSVWGILCGSVCQGVVDQGWENMDLASQDYDSCECDWYEATQGAECFPLINQG